jgi:DNA-binding transcriptional LysR family regulator
MDLRHLRMFVAVAEEGSIHGGARRLMIAQPALSSAMRKLEREVGGPLIIRSRQGVELTDAGNTLLRDAWKFLGQFDQMVAAVQDVAGCERQTLRVGLTAGIAAAADLTRPIISEFRRRYPRIDLAIVDLSLEEQFEAVVEGVVDVAVVRPPHRDDDRIATTPLFSEPRVLCCSREHRLAGATSIGLDEVRDEPSIEMIRTPEPFRSFWSLNGIREGSSRGNYVDTAVTLSQLQLTLMFQPVAIPVSLSGWRLSLSLPELCAVDLPELLRCESVVAHRRHSERPSARAFAQCARQVTEALVDLVRQAELLPA